MALTDTSEKWIKATHSDKPFYYDDLNDTFSSHVHPVFWRLHGWVDDRIEDWYAAHAATHPGQVARKTVGDVPWFAKGPQVSVETPWVGPVVTGHDRVTTPAITNTEDTEDTVAPDTTSPSCSGSTI
ncbi:hypothetical protein [Streptomyces sp. NPDC015130]|uniref:hypothetical protein n=1 Tax=Streptomyces sp. NPDC015130 TaxID=3364940 RepID=UPI0036F6660C